MLRLKPLLLCLIAGLTIFSCKTSPPVEEPLRIQKPVFEITSIVILQAELINTRLKVRVRITNPNAFPVDLSSFQYELYGAGRFWADGTARNVLTVPAEGSAEKELFLVMNFTNMRRDLLDQVIAMERVRYRFTGTAQIATGLRYLPAYTADFNLEGESEVTR
jgi:LEA14-like dessication related protein